MDPLSGDYGVGRFGNVPSYIYEINMGHRGHAHNITGDLLPTAVEQERIV
jgi:hypothetical protein